MAESVFFIGSFLLLVSSACAISQNPAAHFIYVGCSSDKYPANTSYTKNLDYLMISINESAAYKPYNTFNVSSSIPKGTMTALYQCRGDISMPDCTDCVHEAVSELTWLCNQYYQGIIHMVGCSVKYDNSTFLHKQDTTLEMRKCGPDAKMGNCRDVDDDDVSSVDKALDGLLNITDQSYSYRDSTSGSVNSYAQCTGDLSQRQCEECLIKAIRVMKRECSTSKVPKTYGDIFLAKCYVRYNMDWPQSPPEDCISPSQTRIMKIAKVVSSVVLAGIVLFILFQVFRKLLSLRGNGKRTSRVSIATS